MKTSLALGSTIAFLLVSGVSSAATVAYKATLNGVQETPANASAATGTAVLSFDTTTNVLTGTVTFTGISATTAQHIHKGVCGVGGSPTAMGTLPTPTFAGGTGTIVVNVALDAVKNEPADLAGGGLYVNIHTGAFPNGEIRGQIYPTASSTVCAGPGDGGTADGGTADGGDGGDGGGSSGTSGGTSGTSGTSGASGTSGTSGTSGSNGATTTPADGGTAAVPAGDSGGCSTTRTGSDSNGNGLAMMGVAGLGLALVLRSRKKR